MTSHERGSTMGYVNAAEHAGPLFEAGLLTRAEAVRVVLVAADGGLTELGAADVLDRWQTVRAEIDAHAVTVRERLAAWAS